MRVTATPEARSFIQEHGGWLFVWWTDHSCCGGRLTLLDASTESARSDRRFDRVEAEGFTLFLAAGRRAYPDELVIELKGRKRRRVEAYWNGCAYVA